MTQKDRRLLPIVEELRKARLALGLTQQEAAKKSGYSLDAINSWEMGRRIPSLTAILDYAELLGKTLTLSERNETWEP